MKSEENEKKEVSRKIERKMQRECERERMVRDRESVYIGRRREEEGQILHQKKRQIERV